MFNLFKKFKDPKKLAARASRTTGSLKAVEFCPERLDFKMNKAIIKVKIGEKETGRQELEQLLQDGYTEAKIAIEKFCD